MTLFRRRLTVEGLNIERFLRLAAQRGVPLYAVHREQARRVTFECRERDYRELSAWIAEKGWKITEEAPVLMSAWVAFLRKNWGVPLGILLMLVVSAVLYRFVWQIELIGARQYAGDIRTFLTQESVTVGMPRSRLNAAALEERLYQRYPNVARFNVYLHGVTLTVESHIGLLTSEAPENIDNIVASADGVVTQIHAFAGTALVKSGDVVRKGQTLIVGEERGADGETTAVQARGEVFARRWIRCSASVSTVELVSERTGRFSCVNSLATPWFVLPSKPQTPAYLASELERVQTPIVGCFLPIWLQQDTYYEVSQEKHVCSNAREGAARAAYRKLFATVSANEIIDKWIDYCMIEDDTLTATATAEIIEDIAQAALQPP